jgi:hypothetical protein
VSRAWPAVGAAIGALIAAGIAFAFGSWLILGIALVPLALVGFVIPVLLAIDERAVATARDPAAVEARAERLKRFGTRAEVRRCWIMGAADLELAAKRAEFAMDRERLLALAEQWRRRALDA